MNFKPKEPPKIAIKFANIMFVLGISLSIFIVIYAIYKINNPTTPPVSPVFYIYCILSGVLFAALFVLGLNKLSNNLKVSLSVNFLIIVITVYGFEIYLELQRKKLLQNNEIIAEQMGIPFDKRTKMEVINDLKDTGVEAFPNVHPSHLLTDIITKNGLSTKNGIIFPLGGISNKLMVQSNENGYWMMYTGDKYGFHNSNDVYKNKIIDILISGDSFGEGWSVKSEENIGGVLQERGFNVVNIAKSGNGPLLELGSLKEYAEALKPKIVLWVYFVNDLNDLEVEMQSSILKKYLNEDDFSQNLIFRQEEIDNVLKNYIQTELEKIRSKQIESEKNTERAINWKKSTLITIAKLFNIRSMINLNPKLKLTPTRPIFRNILQKSQQMVSSWNGKMYFVYMPTYGTYKRGNKHEFRDFVIQIVNELDIPIIDIHEEVFDPHPDPLSLFPFRMNNHYNDEGYRLVAEAIAKRLKEDGYIPMKSKK